MPRIYDNAFNVLSNSVNVLSKQYRLVQTLLFCFKCLQFIMQDSIVFNIFDLI